MARKRTIAPGFFKNEHLGACSPLARILFAGLWCWADREGRLEDRPRRIKAEVLPYDNADGETLVAELADGGFLERYEAAGIRVIQIVNFRAYQDPHPREAPSTLPNPDGSMPSNSQGPPKADLGSTQGEPGEEPSPASPSCPSSPSCSLGEDLAPSPAASAPEPPPDESPVVALLPCVGAGPRDYPVTEAAVLALSDAHPGVDVRHELRRVRLWLEANPDRRKTHKGVPRFLLTWMGKAQNDSRGRASPTGAKRPHGMIASGTKHEGTPW